MRQFFKVKYYILVNVFIIFFTSEMYAQELKKLPDGGVNLVLSKPLSDLKYTKENLGSAMASDNIITLSTLIQPSEIHHLSVKIALKKTPVKKGDVMLLQYFGKCDNTSLETGEGKLLWLLHFDEKLKKNKKLSQNISNAWTLYSIPFIVDQEVPSSILSMSLQFGFPPQSIQIKDVKLFHYGKKLTLDQLPETQITYQGMEKDAPWRKAALSRIEQHRKGNFKIICTKNNKPLPNVALEVNMKKHYFSWGAAINAKNVLNEDHMVFIKNHFNIIVFENDLKSKSWLQEDKRNTTIKAIDILRNHKIDIKGHVLIWPSFRYCHSEFSKYKGDAQSLRKYNIEYLTDIITTLKGKISRWDVVNEVYTNKEFQKITGDEEILYDGFRILDKIDPSCKKYVNEFGILSKGGIDTKKHGWYYDFVKRIDERSNSFVDGIGMQSHIGTDLTPPEKILEILDKFASLNKRIAISEFTLDVSNPTLRTAYTRDFMITAFSHPAVCEFLFWGYQGNEFDKVDLIDKNWNLGSMGKAFLDLVHKEWISTFEGVSNNDGIFAQRGFYGEYEYKYTINGKEHRGNFKLEPGQETVIKLDLP